MSELFESLKAKHGDDGQVEFVRVTKYPWYLRWLLKWLQGRCQHWAMKADILEGTHRDFAVRWCETCGAFVFVCDGTPTPTRMCRPDWEQ